MATSSQQAGYLAPSTSPINDASFEDVLQAFIVGVTGLPGPLVRPMWQPEPPNNPSHETNWCAFGVVTIGGDAFAYMQHDPLPAGGEGIDRIEADELITVRHSFYGPTCQATSQRYRWGLEIGQNRADLLVAGITVVEVGEGRMVPALLTQRWVRKIDVSVVFRRRAVYSYPIRSIVEAGAGLDNEFFVTPIVVSSNP